MRPEPRFWILLLSLFFVSSLGAGTSSLDFEKPLIDIQIEIARGEYARIKRAPREYVPCTVRLSGEEYQNVALHLKGAKGSFRSLKDKPSLTLDFTRLRETGSRQGWTKIHLNNSVEDPSFLNERIGSELFLQAGVPVPRVGHARVTLNKRDLGLFVMKEGFTPGFLARYFRPPLGRVYEPKPAFDVDALIQAPTSSVPLPANLAKLARAAAQPDLDLRYQRLSEALDLPEFVSFVCTEILIGHWDGYSTARNNHRIYDDTARGKVVYLPAGMDQIFRKPDAPWHPVMAGLVARALLETPQGRNLYGKRFRELFTQLLQPAALASSITETVEALAPSLHHSESRQLRSEASDLIRAIDRRKGSLRLQFARPEPLQLNLAPGESAVVQEWSADPSSPFASLDEKQDPTGRLNLHINARGLASTSWASVVKLLPGTYHFSAQVRALGVVPLPSGKNNGARVRLAGRAESSLSMMNSLSWKDLGFDFKVGTSMEETRVLCEFRGRAGEAWFVKDSLIIRRIE